MLPVRLVAVAALVLLLAPAVAAQLPVSAYHNHATMERDLRALVAEHEDVARLTVLGKSPLGLDIWRVDVARFDDPDWERLPALLVDGGHHGNEILGIEAAYYFLEALLLDASADPSVLDGKRVVVVPVVNPDGWTMDSRTNANLVNLNRNYPWMWNERGTSPTPGGNYAGPSAASESETRLMMGLMESLDLRGYVTFHTGTFDIVLPWDPEVDAPIPDWPLYEKVLAEVEAASGLEWRPSSGTGQSTSHAYGNLGAVAYLPEVSLEQGVPLTQGEVRERVREGVAAARVAFEHLERLGGNLEVVEVSPQGTLLRNTGWGPAYRVTEGAVVAESVAPGAELRLTPGYCATVVYERLEAGEERRATGTLVLGATPECTGRGASPVPAAGVLTALGAVAALAALRRRR